MPSLDETFEALTHFSRALADFNEALQASATDLNGKHEALKGLWNDAAARSYAQVYEPFETATQQYLVHDAPRLSAFIDTKVRMLADFLNGG